MLVAAAGAVLAQAWVGRVPQQVLLAVVQSATVVLELKYLRGGLWHYGCRAGYASDSNSTPSGIAGCWPPPPRRGPACEARVPVAAAAAVGVEGGNCQPTRLHPVALARVCKREARRARGRRPCLWRLAAPHWPICPAGDGRAGEGWGARPCPWPHGYCLLVAFESVPNEVPGEARCPFPPTCNKAHLHP